MTGARGELAREYAAALRSFLEASDEPALSHAYELGRRAMVDGWGLLEMVDLHRQAVDRLLGRSVMGPRETNAAAEFFHELLSPFEMSLRGYRAANDELRRLLEELRLQKKALEDVNRELESFSYSVSHDLRAPLRAIDGFSEILLEDFAPALGGEAARYLRHIREGTAQMAQLIEDLLALARVTRTELLRSDVDLSSLVRTTLERFRSRNPDRNATFTIREQVRAFGDARLLAVVCENLLGNAWKFTSKRPVAEIAFGCEEREGVPTYFVRDNGAGFDMTYAAKLFGAFQRLHSAQDFEGTGIGLATVQRVVHRHGGRIWAEGRVNAGATFYFTLSAERSA